MVQHKGKLFQLEDELENEFTEAVILFDVEDSEDSADMSFDSEVYIYDRNSAFAKDEGWDWNAEDESDD